MNKTNHIYIPPLAAASMIGSYVRRRLFDQLKAIALIVVYLLAFQILVFGTKPSNAWGLAVGIGMTLVGLTMFLEGLFLALMPLGERVGLKLPQRCGLAVILVFGLLLGVGSTFAEPAVASLRTMGGAIKAWEAPLLYSLLENDPDKLVVAIGVGVGVAVAVGMVRLYFGLSIKPFVYCVVPLLLVVSGFCAMDDNLVMLLGLAWDAGAVTTGAVTVPLVLALGIGVSRSVGKQSDGAGGFGIIMLASALPVLAVLILGMLCNPVVPRAMSEEDFFAPEHRSEAMRIFPSESALLSHAYQRGSEVARKMFYSDDDLYHQAILSLVNHDARSALLGDMALHDWLLNYASENEHAVLSGRSVFDVDRSVSGMTTFAGIFAGELVGALRSIVPLTALLLLMLILLLRDRLRHNDEVMLGIAMSLLGMALLTSGIQTGLVPMGDEAGRSLPRVLAGESGAEEIIRIESLELSDVFYAYNSDGEPEPFFHLRLPGGTLESEPFDQSRYSRETGSYEHIVRRQALFAGAPVIAGVGLVLVFAFGLGYGSTLVEPAMYALGTKVEEISAGTIRGRGVVRAVSLGVGMGLVTGVIRILYDIPVLWLITPPYLLLLGLTWRSQEDFAGIAWDCGGVTTGVVTVPLTMAMGLGFGGELNVVDGFGTLAMASVYPIVTVLIYGLALHERQIRNMHAAEEMEDG